MQSLTSASQFVLLLLASVLLSMVAAPSADAQAGVERVFQRARPDLPGMGPSLRSKVSFSSSESVGTIVIEKDEKALFLVTGRGEALRYAISVGREGFGWTGIATVAAKKEWPEWRPPVAMRERQPELPEFVPAGPYNPLGARALYLYKDGRDTLYRIHGTNDPDGIGFDGTSGCFRLTNTDVIDLFARVRVGAKVVVE